MRRVVITGIGAVSPLGCGAEHVWSRVLAGDCGISVLPKGLVSENIGVHVAGQVPVGEEEETHKEMSKITQYGLARCGVVLATGGVGSISDILDGGDNLKKSFRKLSPYFIPKVLTNMAAGHVSLRHNLRGPLLSPSTACAAGSHAVGDAYNLIRMGYADLVLAGGAESCLDPLSMSGFARMRALTSNEDPKKASKPFDADRDGFVMSEGSCVLVLEELEAAVARNAPIIAEICGYGLSSDAHHITAPSPSGEGALRSMKMAIQDAAIAINDIGYVNAHATSTPQGDAVEAGAVATLFENEDNTLAGEKATVYLSSTKGATGHLLGAAGALETAFTALAVRDSALPATLNLEHPDPEAKANDTVQYVKGSSVRPPNPLQYALKNSFGFGGTNASIVLGKVA
eukprot:GSChrysophyteH1.ASY1.ANO1.280.1 assembled CDS